jgi:hypothetical protein
MSNLFGGVVADNDKSLVGGNGGKYGNFGLNQNAKLVKLSYNNEQEAWQAVDVTVLVGEKKFMHRAFIPNRVYKNNVQLQEGDEGYEEALNKEFTQLMGYTVHLVKSTGVNQDAIEKVVAKAKAVDFEGWVSAVLSVVDVTEEEPADVDVFLQYQWTIKEGQDKTWLELPKNMKDGYWIVPATAGTFKEVLDGELSYISGEGNKHAFVKSENFMESNKAIQQGSSVKKEEKASPFSSTPANNTTGTTPAAATGWGK